MSSLRAQTRQWLRILRARRKACAGETARAKLAEKLLSKKLSFFAERSFVSGVPLSLATGSSDPSQVPQIKYIGLGEWGVATEPGHQVCTMGLGSCIALTAFHPLTGVVGMAHIVMPNSQTKSGVPTLEAHYADMAVPHLVSEMKKATGGGAFVFKMIGGAKVLRALSDTMDIGRGNALAVKKALWRLGAGAIAEEIGGTVSRTVSVEFGQKKVSWRIPGDGWRKL